MGHQRVKRPANLRVSRGIEGRVGDVFVNTPKMFQSVMSVWCPSDLGSDMCHVASRRRDSEQAAERAPVRHVGSGGSAERVLLNLT